MQVLIGFRKVQPLHPQYASPGLLGTLLVYVIPWQRMERVQLGWCSIQQQNCAYHRKGVFDGKQRKRNNLDISKGYAELDSSPIHRHVWTLE